MVPTGYLRAADAFVCCRQAVENEDAHEQNNSSTYPAMRTCVTNPQFSKMLLSINSSTVAPTLPTYIVRSACRGIEMRVGCWGILRGLVEA